MKYRDNIKSMNPNELVSWFLIASYAYYKLGCHVMSDRTFDILVKRLKRLYSKADHPHKHLITKSHLNATTGYDIDYPNIVKYTAMNYARGNK